MKYKILITLCLFFSTTLSADDFRRADSFFEKGNPAKISKGDFYGIRKDDNNTNAKPPSYIKDPSKIVPNDTREKAQQSILKNKGSITNNIPSTNTNHSGIKVLSLGVVINSLDENHLEKHLNTLIKTSTKFDLDINEVDFVGIDNDVTKKFGFAIISRFGEENFMSAPPIEYNITTSPTWILQTANGQILLEGIDNPEIYMNSQAEFIDSGKLPYQNDSNERGSSFFENHASGMEFF